MLFTTGFIKSIQSIITKNYYQLIRHYVQMDGCVIKYLYSYITREAISTTCAPVTSQPITGWPGKIIDDPTTRLWHWNLTHFQVYR